MSVGLQYVGRSAVICQSVRLSQSCAWLARPRPPPRGRAQLVFCQSARLLQLIFWRFCFAMLIFPLIFVVLDTARGALGAVAGGRSPCFFVRLV